MKNKFIVLEGIEGAGKTEACLFIKKILKKINITNVVAVREPGSTLVSEEIRKLIKYNNTLTKKAELLLFYASRVQLVETVIKPALMQGNWIISDRYDLSSLAYQGGGLDINQHLIISLRKMFLNDCKPDLTIYLDVTPKIGLERIRVRKNLDKIEKKSLNFFVKVRNSYLKLAASDSDIITIDATFNKNVVKKEIKNQLYQWINKQCL
ncbi:thymidylate kinase [Buchnera aphidicola (Nipponaphis monzeni)]|uniref:Thymidylate kinase n=2 Tax=Buchnera aphidicola TaxID=9 RepID=A0A455TAA9_9GAMM|nr:thymidylate kinase [Buchnera aphidicola (Nipponaphis monzeni)]